LDPLRECRHLEVALHEFNIRGSIATMPDDDHKRDRANETLREKARDRAAAQAAELQREKPCRCDPMHAHDPVDPTQAVDPTRACPTCGGTRTA
jgi:hypothetical protein